ncbi:MAG: anmK [Armatimonadetes bacterium]|nr:anmK [Armatimonadota bacterium]
MPLAFVATHGQTIWHEPAGPGRSTLQIGQAARIAVRLGVPVVSDFRQQDFALGGQGAPLVPYLDHLLFAHSTRSRACQNLGGIGNVTYLPAGAGPEAVVAFDTGPANALMDRAAVLVSQGQLSCDQEGLLAASAPVDEALLSELLSEPYLDQAPPKSTGRELFSAERVDQLWARGFRGAGLVSTLTQYTVRTIADAYQRWLGAVDEVILAGGGVRNPELVRRLREALPKTEVRTADELGLNSDAKEAIAFAMFGYETLRGRPSNVPAATGAARAAIQGKITWP